MPYYHPIHYQYRKTDHLLHFIITLFTCGIWTVGWVSIAITNAVLNQRDYHRAKTEYRYYR